MAWVLVGSELQRGCTLVLLPARDGSAYGLSPHLGGMQNQGRSGPGSSWCALERLSSQLHGFLPCGPQKSSILGEQGEKMAFNDSGMWDIN